ncbi:MAG: hypothetical protein PHP95_12955 [Desulfuromonadaceae bacterium]|nr:hypothetical protein [Desulfuromonadaceae bacterium]MDD2849353.1 hypothetical protein [Desulfuromonadaceae bacterium]MDD4129412.1 hypothetical protein [Desulfuromonadaceae bacterium]
MFRNLVLNKKMMLMVLVSVSAVLYSMDYVLLGSAKELTIWFLGNLAFLPVYVIIVTLLIESVLKERERQSVMRKLNMVIGVFFSEVGNRLLKELSAYVVACDDLKRHLLVNGTWKEQEFSATLEYLRKNEIKIESGRCEKIGLKMFLVEKRGFLVSLLENQNLLEHEEFTDLLWAVFHLVEELEARDSFENMPQSDVDHINGDIKRVFGHLSREWVMYMQHLKHDYPYLFSLAVRLNPMIDSPDPAVY